MNNIIAGTGIFIYPLAICSLAVVFILIERFWALQKKKIMPLGFLDRLLRGERPTQEEAEGTVAGRIADFFFSYAPDAEALKAYAQVEITKMERGFFILEIVVAGAPLLGLLGTVMGLVRVFGNYHSDSGMPDPSLFVDGIALALTTTMLGLTIALPALIAHSYFTRRVDLLAAEIDFEVERLLQAPVSAEYNNQLS